MEPEERALLRRYGEELLVAETRASRIVRLCPACGSDRHGRPVALGSSATVSMAYAGGLVAVAWSWSGPVGIDVEREGPPVGDVGSRRSWTRIEALLKATGEGLRRDPRDLTGLTDLPGLPGLPDLPDLPTAPLTLPTGYVGTVAGHQVSWRLAGPGAPCGPASGRTAP